jgi:adenylate cyclase class 2
LTFKGPRQKARSFKVREEFETDAANRGQLKKILKALGLQPVFGYRNYRTIFRKGRLTIALDETKVGTYLELEGERHEITKFAKALGFSRADFITTTYAELRAGKENDGERV